MFTSFFRISQRLVFLSAICLLVQFALIIQLLRSSSSSVHRNSIPKKFLCKYSHQTCPHFSIHIDRNARNLSVIRSPIFAQILATIRTSSYYTDDSSSACLHIVPVDTIDRDRRSKHGHFTYFLEQRLHFFDTWSNPNRTHLIFNHYTGTWPTYRRSLDFNLPSKSILASTSFTPENYDCFSHVTFPLFHADYPKFFSSNRSSRSILLSFKGRSYDDVQHHRTFFRHLHNGRDIIIEYTDENRRSEHDYIQLLDRSDFCLVPSGRRLSSYRFLESLQHGCIPVLTGDESFLLPYSEIIDWSQSIVIAFNSTLSLLPYHLRKISQQQREQMRKQGRDIWQRYFSSIERIVLTLLDILRQRFEYV